MIVCWDAIVHGHLKWHIKEQLMLTELNNYVVESTTSR